MKQITVVRRDLRMSVGKTASQVAHAVVGVLRITESKTVDAWNAEGMPKIVLGVDTEDEMLELMARGKRVKVFIVADAGRTEVEKGTMTCFAFAPCKDEDIDDVTGGLKLL